MLKTIERYQKCNYGAPETNITSREVQSSKLEYIKLKSQVEALQRSQRNLLGEELGPLSGKELEQLELQLDASLKQIRSTRTQNMLDQLGDLQKRELLLCETNKLLRRRLEETNQLNPQQVWDTNISHALGYGQQSDQVRGEDFYQPLQREPTLQIGYNSDITANASCFVMSPVWLA